MNHIVDDAHGVTRPRSEAFGELLYGAGRLLLALRQRVSVRELVVHLLVPGATPRLLRLVETSVHET